MTDEMKAKREKLFSAVKNGYDLVDQAALDAMETYCESYKQYLDNGKTERECAAYTVELAQAQGFVPYQRGMELKPGDMVYQGDDYVLVSVPQNTDGLDTLRPGDEVLMTGVPLDGSQILTGD